MVVDFRKKGTMYVVPMIILHRVCTKILDCHHGKDRNIKLKELNKKKKESGWVRASSFFFKFIVGKGFKNIVGKRFQRGVKNIYI